MAEDQSHDVDGGSAALDDAVGPTHPETLAITGGRADQGGALAPLLWGSTTFETETAAEAAALAGSVDPDRFYSRHGNPGVRAFESAVADLEGAEAARAFASGMGAVVGVVLGICSAGDHIVTQRQIYSLTQLVFQGVCPRFGIEVTTVDGTEPGAFAAAVRPGQTTLVFAESPANPRLDLVDLEEIGAIRGPVTCVDSTFATPLAQRPLDYGVDLVLHSATKGLGGHNDASLGIVCGSKELIDWIWGFAILQGANASPFDAMNGLRGLRTLGVRLRRQSETAQALAELLEGDDAVASVRYPGLDSHPQRDLAKRQLSLTGAIMSFDLAGGREAGQAFVEAVQVARMATSLGGPETLVCHPASTTHANLLPEELEAAGIGPGTIRLSVGLEHPDDLAADLRQALRAYPA
jgi:cystathionine beta-lyase/cystathionine gamma-synthase